MRRLVNHDNPEGRETPLLLLADLRAIEHCIELVYVGDGLWWIGRVSPDDRLRDAGWRMEAGIRAGIREEPSIAEMASTGRNLMLARLTAQGFRRFLQVRAPGGDCTGTVFVDWIDPTMKGAISQYPTTIHKEVEERYSALERDGGAAKFAERAALTDGTAAKAASDRQFQEYLKTEGLANYRREVRNRVTFGYGGMTGGTGSGLIHLPR